MNNNKGSLSCSIFCYPYGQFVLNFGLRRVHFYSRTITNRPIKHKQYTYIDGRECSKNSGPGW